MKTVRIFLFGLLLICHASYCQQYPVSIESYPQMVKADPRLILQTGYLVVPENRSRPNGRTIRLPFFFVRRPDQDAHKNITLHMTGGPGYSTTANIDSISYNSGFLRYGGFIALDQRGTKRTQPCLECGEVNEAIRQSYRENKNRDSLVLAAVKQCRKKLEQQGIDLSAYNTQQSVEDINDLRLALHVDSLYMVGISYSGGLMLETAKQHPEAVRALILDSPLPAFVNHEEGGLLNINEALEQVFKNCAADSADKAKYEHLRTRFHTYFSTIHGKKFTINYQEKDKKDGIRVVYTKNELLDAVVSRLNTAQVKTVPGVIDDIINGKHHEYVKEVLDDYFAGDLNVALGMRYSILCSEQVLYANPVLEQQQHKLLPWLAGYAFNNVNHAMCDCWKVKPASKTIKEQAYTNVPALLSAGDIDPWCRPFYSRLIKRYLPNSQLLIIHDRGHGAGFVADGVIYLDDFVKEPFKKLVAQSKNIIVE